MTRGLSGHLNNSPGGSPSSRKKNPETQSSPSHTQHNQPSVSSRREQQATNTASKKGEDSNQNSISATMRSKLGTSNKPIK